MMYVCSASELRHEDDDWTNTFGYSGGTISVIRQVLIIIFPRNISLKKVQEKHAQFEPTQSSTSHIFQQGTLTAGNTEAWAALCVVAS